MTALDVADAAAAAQGTPLRQRADLAPIPPLIAKFGIADLLGVSTATVKRLRGASRKALAEGTHSGEHFPVPDRIVEFRPLWYPLTIATWAIANSVPLRTAGRIIPPVIELWSQQDIADHFTVAIDTVRDRWRFDYVHAINNNQKPPPKALPPESFNVEGVLFWLPEVVLEWGEKQGKLDDEQQPNPRHHLRWVSKTVADKPAPPPDEVQLRIDAGELWDREKIGEFFGVSKNTVKMWLSGTSGSAGKDFPDPDGPATRRGKETWLPSTVIAWGEGGDDDDEGSRRIVNGQVVRARGGRPTGSTKDKILAAKEEKKARSRSDGRARAKAPAASAAPAAPATPRPTPNAKLPDLAA